MIGLIQVDGKLPNLALMKISSYYKALGEDVEFVRPKQTYQKIYASAIFTSSAAQCHDLQQEYGSLIEIGGTGWDIKKKLPPEIDACVADYSLYSTGMIERSIKGARSKAARVRKAEEIVNAGIGFSSRGCVRNCKFCVVPRKEGRLRQDQQIKDIINPKSNIIILNDNNLTADPACIQKLEEIRGRRLTVDINQGLDIRFMTDPIAKIISEVKHLRSIHYAWDLMEHEEPVINGIKILLKYAKAWRHMCYMLVGFNTTFEEDYYRFRRLNELGIRPYVMRYNDNPDRRLHHFARWVNGFVHTSCSFEEYEPWAREQERVNGEQLSLL